jgi:hypothetical protein
MPEEIAEVTPPAESATDTPTDVSEATPAEPVDKWDVDFSAKEEVAEVETPVTEPEQTPVIEEAKAEEPNAPEDEPTPEEIEAAQGGPVRLGRAQLREVESKVITPLRDPSIPIADVRQAIAQFQPERMRELEQTIVDESVERYPDKWLEAVTGIEGLTVDKVKNWHENPQAEKPTTESSDDLGSYLSEFYGDNWKDPAYHAQMDKEDARLANIAIRLDQMKGQEQNPEWKVEKEKLEAKLNDLQPKVDAFLSQQETEYKNFEQSTYETIRDEYVKEVEGRVVPKILTEAGLDVSENDTANVKAVKEMVRGAFTSEDGASQFDLYLGSKYPGRESLGKTIQGIDRELTLAAQKQALAEKKAAPGDKQRLLSEAQAHRAEAKSQQDAVTVMHKKAAAEFLKTLEAPMALLEENAQLQRQLGLNGSRVEITGSASAPGKSLNETIREKGEGKWDIDFLSEQMSQAR